VTFGQRLIQFDRFLRRLLGASCELGRRSEIEIFDKQVVRVGQSGVRLGVSRIDRDCLLKIIDCLVEAFFGAPVPIVAAFQIVVIGCRIGGA
jgi:hypothetical protein